MKLPLRPAFLSARLSPMKKYEIWSDKLVEIGNELGGWAKDRPMAKNPLDIGNRPHALLLLGRQLQQHDLRARVLQTATTPAPTPTATSASAPLYRQADVAYLPGAPQSAVIRVCFLGFGRKMISCIYRRSGCFPSAARRLQGAPSRRTEWKSTLMFSKRFATTRICMTVLSTGAPQQAV